LLRAAIGFAIVLCVSQLASAAVFDQATRYFAGKVDLRQWEVLPAQHAGRVKILDSVARGMVAGFYGKSGIDAASPTFCFMEMFLNGGAYLKEPVIEVHSGALRDRLLPMLDSATAMALRATGHLPPMGLLAQESIHTLMEQHRVQMKDFQTQRLGVDIDAFLKLQEDLKLRSQLGRFWQSVNYFIDLGSVRIVPPRGGGEVYLSLPELDQQDSELAGRFAELRSAWRNRDVDKANSLLCVIRTELASRPGHAALPAWQRSLELFHNRIAGFSIAWIGFALAVLVLLVAVSLDSKPWGIGGFAFFLLVSLFLLAGFIIRWILSGRGWHLPPLTNQFESILAAAVLACLAAIVLEILFRRWFFALAASIFSCVSLLTAYFNQDAVGWQIEAPHGILNTPILAWHVATLMIGYAVIGMSLVISISYLIVAAVERSKSRDGVLSAGIDLASGADSEALPAQPSLLVDLDRSNLILIQLGCWLVGVGVALGAFWGDQAWGRWWGWDPKETWGLETFLVYLGIVHARYVLPRHKRGVWTAALAIVGCAVMAFTWFGVNYLLSGLHSYA
jgi:ABC-type transport system involved in cytochrome c biogenesis permease subunit